MIGLCELTALTRRIATEVRAGLHDVPIDPDRRWYRHLRGVGAADVWLIGWHDHRSARRRCRHRSCAWLGGAATSRCSTPRPDPPATSSSGSADAAYAAAVVDQAGVGAVFALPLQWATINLGVLDLYRRCPGSLATAEMRDAMGASDTAAWMLLGLRTDPGGS